MKIRFYIALVLLAGPLLHAQRISPDKVEATPGKPIVLEYTGDLGKDDVISWVTRSGKGTIRVGADQKKIEFTPDGPAGTIVVVCIIVPSHGARKEVSAQIKVQPANSVSEAAPPPPNVQPAVPGPAHVPPAVAAQIPPAQHNGDGYIDALGFIPAGFMGSAQEGQTVNLNQGSTDQCHSGPACIRLEYTPETAQTAPQQSRVPWFAIAWQFTNGEPNWGDSPGKDLDAGRAESARFRSLRVWARGVLTAGGPPVVQFKSGGGTKRGLAENQRASYEVVGRFQPLTTSWAEHCLDLSGKKLTNVVSAFTIVMERAGNPNGAVVYLDDIHFSSQACQAGTRH